jgi:phosphatidylglycerol:prolipoprotein diacylglycerol transferase
MRPVLFEVGHVAVGGYGLFVALGIFVASALAVRAASRSRMDVGRVIATIACAAFGAYAGAMGAFYLVELARGTFALGNAGFVFFGAIPGGLFAGLISGRMLGVDALRLLDLSIPGLAAGHALGRVGCLLGGCCYGRPFDGPWAVVYDDPRAPAGPEPRHPAPLYEAAGLIVLSVVFALAPAQRADGSRALAYLAAYSILRIAVELFRGDEVRGVWSGISTAQIVSVAAIFFSIATFAIRRR